MLEYLKINQWQCCESCSCCLHI
uniref:Uncharacterized protein n=1 Tax=Anguilla anguilla TaxID=7936 RepID=A0A0E9RUL7_ANGAN